MRILRVLTVLAFTGCASLRVNRPHLAITSALHCPADLTAPVADFMIFNGKAVEVTVWLKVDGEF